MTLVGGEAYREDLLDAAMERYNEALRTVARVNEVPMLDLARALPKSLDFFYDDVHFNVRGADTTAALLADFLIERGLTRPRPAGTVVAFRRASTQTRDE
jgi:hypothetical protein